MSIGKRSRRDVNKIRKIVFARDNETCVVRGSDWGIISPCDDTLTIQHRVTRGMGSSNLFDTPRDLVTMCATHNSLEPVSADFRSYCEASGWSVRRSYASQWGLNRIPVRYGQEWFLLDGNERFRITKSVAKELMEDLYGEDSD